MEFPFLKWKLDSRLHTQKRAMSEGQVICEGSEIMPVTKQWCLYVNLEV